MYTTNFTCNEKSKAYAVHKYTQSDNENKGIVDCTTQQLTNYVFFLKTW